MASTPQPNDSKALLAHAKELQKERRFRESRIAFDKIITLSMDSAERVEAFYQLGVIDFNEGDLGAAATCFRRCLSVDPKNANSYFFLGEISARQNRPNQAEEFYKKAIEINPTHQAARDRLSARQSQDNPVIDKRTVVPAGGIYDYIRNDPSALAKQTIQLIDSLTFSSMQRISAFAAPIAFRVLALFLIPYLLITLGPPTLNAITRRGAILYGKIPVWIAIAFVIFQFVNIGFYILRIKTTKFTFDKGRLRIASGVLSRSEPNHELYRVEDVSLSQSFANRLTGDGTISLRVSSGHGPSENISLIGLAKIDELRAIFDKLRELVLLLRTGAWGKGVIY